MNSLLLISNSNALKTYYYTYDDSISDIIITDRIYQNTETIRYLSI